MNSGVLLAAVFYPMAGALAAYLTGKKTKTGRDFLAVFIGVTEFLLLLAANVLLQGAEVRAPGICGMPFWNGYISKTLLHESIVEYSKAPAFVFVEWIFLISGGLTVAYMLKLYIALFIEKNEDPKLQKRYEEMNGHYIRKPGMLALGISAAVLPVFGLAGSGGTGVPPAAGEGAALYWVYHKPGV